MYKIVNAKEGHCPMCIGKDSEKARPLFTVEGPGYTGDICGTHLHVLSKQNGNGKHAEPLFDRGNPDRP
jgi:hypothetical protein